MDCRERRTGKEGGGGWDGEERTQGVLVALKGDRSEITGWEVRGERC